MMTENDNTYPHPNNLQDSDVDNSYESKATDKTSEINTTKNILLYRNGDKFFPPKRFVVNKKYIRSWDFFLEELTRSIQPRNGAIRCIRTPFHGTRIKSLDDLIINGKYVAISKGENMKMMDYNSVIDVTSPSYQTKQEKRQPKSLRPTNHDMDKVESKINQLYTKGIAIYVYRNGDPFTRGIKIVVGHLEQRHMNTLVKAIEERVLLPSNRPIRRLYSMDGQLIRYAKDVENGQYYVAASNEPFENIKYGQYLPVIRGGKAPSGRQKIKYLNQSPTPAKDGPQSDSSANGGVTQRSPKSENNTERTKQKPVTSRNQKKPSTKEMEKKESAAIKIQSAFRGYLVRNEIKKAQENNGPVNLPRSRYEPKKPKLQQRSEVRANKPSKQTTNDKATANKENVQKQKEAHNSEEKKKNVKEKAIENKKESNSNNKNKTDQKRKYSEKDELAAAKIQAGFRGYLLRKQLLHNQTPSQEKVKETNAQNVVTKENNSSNKDSKKEEANNKKQDSKLKDEGSQKDETEETNEDEDERKISAAVSIQAAFRGFKAREMLKETEETRRKEAAFVIQFAYRGYKTRRQLKESDDIGSREKAATVIQSAFRGFQTRKTIYNEKLAEEQATERNAAAARIQAAFRGFKLRRDAAE